MESAAHRGIRRKTVSLTSRNTVQTPTAQAIKKLSAQPGETQVPRPKAISKSVNYLSSTKSSRAKAATGVQVHKLPPPVSSASQIAGIPLTESEGNLRMKTNTIEETSMMSLSKRAGHSSSLSSGRKSVRSHREAKTVPKGGSMSTENPTPNSTTDTEKLSSIGSSHKTALRPSVSGKTVHVTMNKTSELRAALHKRTVKPEGPTTKTTIKNSKLGRMKRRPRKIGTNSAPKSVPFGMTT